MSATVNSHYARGGLQAPWHHACAALRGEQSTGHPASHFGAAAGAPRPFRLLLPAAATGGGALSMASRPPFCSAMPAARLSFRALIAVVSSCSVTVSSVCVWFLQSKTTAWALHSAYVSKKHVPWHPRRRTWLRPSSVA